MTRLLPLLLLACSPEVQDDRCDGPGAFADYLEPQQSAEHYIAQSHAYFDTMDYEPFGAIEPDYSELVARWEWPPWLKLTGWTRDKIIATDQLLVLLPSVVPIRDCRAFDTNPFGRCTVTFYYDDHEGRPCPIYEEFTFNDAGEITFIEAWSDLDGMRPQADGDPWAEGEVDRLANRIPGLGTADGRIELTGKDLLKAADSDADVADFLAHANDFEAKWLENLEAAGDEYWTLGCGWDPSTAP